MPQKSKVLPKLKIQAIESYLTGEKSWSDIVTEFGISKTTMQDWIRLYKLRGPEGLIPKENIQTYSKKLKLEVINEYNWGIHRFKTCATNTILAVLRLYGDG